MKQNETFITSKEFFSKKLPILLCVDRNSDSITFNKSVLFLNVNNKSFKLLFLTNIFTGKLLTKCSLHLIETYISCLAQFLLKKGCKLWELVFYTSNSSNLNRSQYSVYFLVKNLIKKPCFINKSYFSTYIKTNNSIKV